MTAAQGGALPQRAIGTYLRRFTPAQAGVFITVMVAAGLLAYFGVDRLLTPSEATAATQRDVPVRRGDLVSSVSASGSVTFPRHEDLAFPASGELGEILVAVGDVVEAGQVLARLDAASIATLERQVAEAQLAVRAAEQELAEASSPASAAAVAKANAELANAHLAVASARRALEDAEAGEGSDSVQVAEAKLAVNTAATSLSNAQASLRQLEFDHGTKVADAEQAAAGASANYFSVLQTWFGAGIVTEDSAVSPADLLASWDATFASIFGPALTQSGAPPDDPSTPWNEHVAFVWMRLYPQPVQATCDRTVAQTFRCAEDEVWDSWEAIAASQSDLEAAVAAESTALTTARAAVSSAEAALRTAERKLEDAIDPATLEARRAELAAAIAAEAEAQQAVDEATTVDTLVATVAEKKLDEARAQLANAQDALSSAVIRAPFAGVVTSVGATPGDSVTPSDAIATVLDQSIVEVAAVVDEIDVLSLQLGANVQITMDALPGRVLPGVITEIGESDSQQGVVSYPVTARVQIPDGLTLREGLSATARFVAQQETNILMVPSQAVGGNLIQPTVRVKRDGKVEIVPVTLGITDGFWVAVRSGLTDGDVVVMEVPEGGSTGQGSVFIGGSGVEVIPIGPGGSFRPSGPPARENAVPSR